MIGDRVGRRRRRDAADVHVDASSVPARAPADDFTSDGECLLYNPGRDEASALNRTATEIWQLCDGVRSIDGIARILGERYGLDRDLLLGDVTRALLTLRSRGLIEFPGGRGR
jgi:hypothetical protein